LYRGWALSGAIDSYDVKPDRFVSQARMTREKQSGRLCNAALFAPVDGLHRRHKSCGLPEANLDEHQAIAVAHHEVDFSEAATKVLREKHEASGFEMMAGERFGMVSGDLFSRPATSPAIPSPHH
jgi:hypothetical protein